MVWGTESWVLSSVPGSESVVSDGPKKGAKITDIFPGEFPLLIKFIDAKRDLSIQVHPDDALAAERHHCKGKTEMWYIIDAAKGAHLISGLKQAITPEEYVRLVEKDKITDVLQDYEVSKGDVFFLPAGRIHAIGGGCYLAEIQQTSDITYRIYDYGRLGLDGKPRQLHTELAKDAIDYTVYPDYRTHYSVQENRACELVHCPQFCTDLLSLTEPFSQSLGNAPFKILIAVEGEVALESSSGRAHLAPGECALALALEDEEIKLTPLSGKATLLTSTC